MDTVSKQNALLELAHKRQADKLDGYYCLADFHDGYYECDYVVPWTKSAHEVDASLMLMAQDWASEKFLRAEKDADMARLGQKAGLPTNTRLKELLKANGFPPFGETYATDVFPFIKPGGMSSRILFRDFVLCARNYALPQIAIVRPKMVLCLGLQTFNGLRRALEMRSVENLGEAALPTGHTVYRGTEIYGVGHPGAWASKRLPEMAAEWATLAHRFRQL